PSAGTWPKRCRQATRRQPNGWTGVMAVLLQSYRVIGTELVPFLPGPVGEVRADCGGSDGGAPEPRPWFGRMGEAGRDSVRGTLARGGPAGPGEVRSCWRGCRWSR